MMLVMTSSSAETTAAAEDIVAFEAKRLSVMLFMLRISGKQHITATAIRKILFMKDILSCMAIKPFLPKPKAVLKKVPSFPRSSK